MAIVIFLIVAAFLLVNSLSKKTTKEVQPIESIIDSKFLDDNILFYKKLTPSQKKQFEFEMDEFLNEVNITPINTTIEASHKMYIAASAVIPVFAFPNWKYGRLLNEVLLYDDAFDKHFNTKGANRDTLGMIGTGYLEGKMLLSKHALELGFNNKTDKNNTAIHEFVHLIDKADGDIDGVPKVLLDKQYTIPWIDMIFKEMEKRKKKDTDINDYGYTNEIEFFAVISEYFFERPDLLKQKHPHLYSMLEKVFKQKV
jgi:Mlc titration factor MtfA (ptsG expression regulator)